MNAQSIQWHQSYDGNQKFEGDATCFKILTFEEVEQNKREALSRLQQASKEDLINYLISDNICNDCLSEGS